MVSREIKLKAFSIAGITIRTTNEEQKTITDIGTLFARFFSENIIEKIPSRLSDDIYCVYTDYESDYTGEYSVIIGCKIKDGDTVDKSLIVKKIHDSKYIEYKSSGELHAAVSKTWTEIWNSKEISRAYQADFDIYGQEAIDPQNATIYTYLSVL